MNGALGMAGIALGLAASVLGGVTLVLGVVQHRSRLVRSGTIYVWLVLAGAVLSVAAMERALIKVTEPSGVSTLQRAPNP